MTEANIENITNSDSNFASTFVYHHLLPDISFNGHCLRKNNIFYPSKSNKSIYILHTKSRIKNFKQSFYIR